ncbi:hypothetical protein K435DRAFT_963720 [Dendrothele bispora CBS 962.96]|uniref:Uncharacterized protein n=1 Tax=Dendrothele bispora (strain CBS 962.96) TaxID=1314807 RepID=A0A4S8MEK6_DENBC|nr:hypothetical protein K435DRAFT_963720 [Dendrothele bispora CBS 962.96]
MTSPVAAQKPIPFLSGLALTETQLRILANHYLSSDVIKQHSPAQDADFDEDEPRCYLYILDVVPSYDGKPPKPNFSSKHLTWMWKKLGKPPAWDDVKFVVRRWPQDPGLPEPKWLHERMYSNDETSQPGNPQA